LAAKLDIGSLFDLFSLSASIGVMRSCIHILSPDGCTGTIAGMSRP
jgi:hypothetical protein